MEGQAAGAVSEKRAYLLNQGWADPLSAVEGEEGRRFHVVKTSFHVEEEGGDLVAEAVEGFNVML